MENRIENISPFRYLWTIITGKSKQFYKFGDVQNGKIINDNFIVTIGEQAIIVTQVQNGKRTPIIVKRWRKIGKSGKKEYPIVQWFIDSNHNNWSCYYSDTGCNLINCRNDDNFLIYEFK